MSSGGEEADAGSRLDGGGSETRTGGVFVGGESEGVEFTKLRASSCSFDLFGDC